jgi:integrase
MLWPKRSEEDSPCGDIRNLIEREPDRRPFTRDELMRLLQYTRENASDWHDLLVFWSRTGVRCGELCAFQWKDIDWFYAKAEVRRSICNKTGKPRIPKTGSRVIDLRPEAIRALTRQRKRTELVGNYVFLNPTQKHWRAYEFQWAWPNLLKRA